MQTFIQFVKSEVSASHCQFCHKQADIELSLCQTCINDLPKNNHACLRCAIPLTNAEDGLICGHCQNDPFKFNQSSSPYLYQDRLIPLIHQLKYQEKLYIARTLAQLFIKQLRKKHIRIPQVLIPIPLHPNKLKNRGFNQAEEISYFIAKELQIPMENKILYREKETQSQQSLDAKHRHNNMNNAFKHIQDKKLFAHYEHIALIDDVMTTGNTLQSAAKELKKAGISLIDTWTIARA